MYTVATLPVWPSYIYNKDKTVNKKDENIKF
jgi:hypothetical protein